MSLWQNTENDRKKIHFGDIERIILQWYYIFLVYLGPLWHLGLHLKNLHAYYVATWPEEMLVSVAVVTKMPISADFETATNISNHNKLWLISFMILPFLVHMPAMFHNWLCLPNIMSLLAIARQPMCHNIVLLPHSDVQGVIKVISFVCYLDLFICCHYKSHQISIYRLLSNP